MCYSIGLRQLDQSDSGIKLYPMLKRVERFAICLHLSDTLTKQKKRKQSAKQKNSFNSRLQAN